MMKEGQYMEGPLRDTMTENQPPVTSPDGFSNTNPPENCTGPLYSQDCPQKDHTIPHHNQSGDLFDLKIKIKEEEEETYVWSDQQPMEEGDMMETIKVEELEMYVWSDQQPVEEGDMMGTNKEEEEETYVRSDQQSMEEGDMMGTIKEEELEMYVWSDQQSTEEADFMVTPKEENMPLNIGADGSRIPPERCTSPLYFENVPQEDHNYAHGHIVTEKEKSNFILSGKKWFTTAELIAKVQMHPEFYDKRNPGYKDTARNNLVWADIAAEFAENIWDELSEKDKAEKIEQLKKRWKSVRDNYRRELDKQISEERSGARATNRRKYKFTAFLEFLRTYHKSVPTEDNLPNDDATENIDTDLEISERLSVETSATSVQDCEESTPVHSPNSPSTSSRPPCTRNVSYRYQTNSTLRRAGRGISRAAYDQKLITSIEKAVTHMEKRDKKIAELNEPCTQFLMSLLPSLQKVPPDRQLAAKRALIDTLEKFVPQELPTVPQEPYYYGHGHMPHPPAPYGPPQHQPYYGQHMFEQQNYSYPPMQHATQRHPNPYYPHMPPPMNPRHSTPHDSSPERAVFTDLSAQQTSQNIADDNSPNSEARNMSQLLF